VAGPRSGAQLSVGALQEVVGAWRDPRVTPSWSMVAHPWAPTGHRATLDSSEGDPHQVRVREAGRLGSGDGREGGRARPRGSQPQRPAGAPGESQAEAEARSMSASRGTANVGLLTGRGQVCPVAPPSFHFQMLSVLPGASGMATGRS